MANISDPYWSGDALKRLMDSGVLPENTRKATIVLEEGCFVSVTVECHPKTADIEEALNGYLFKSFDKEGNDGHQEP